MNLKHLLFLFFCLLSFNTLASPQHALAMHGEPKYGPDFKHFDYVNPKAPKGGKLVQAVVGDNFDSFNPFIIKGVTGAGTGYVFETLTVQSNDEAFSQYGLIAERMEMPKDRSWVTFYLNPKARFSDGQPITAEDVKFSFETLTQHPKARPHFRFYYADVKTVTIIDPLIIRFDFKNDQNKELPLILGQLPVLAKHYWKDHDFGAATLEFPIGSGPYVYDKVDPGRSITMKRNPDYWGKDLPVNVGKYNFDTLRFEYYKDNTIALEAFKAGEYDFRLENVARNWATAYNGPKFKSGELIKEPIKHERPVGMQGFVFNSRRSLLSNPEVRKALMYAFDFEWTNKNIFYGQYARTHSYFENSELASRGLPGGEELEILTRFKDQLPKQLFTKAYQVPSTAKPSSVRKNLRTALRILKAQGWNIKQGKLTNNKGDVFKFEFLLAQKDFERVIQPFIKNLEKLGVNATIRVVDVSQYINRIRSFDFDAIVSTLPQSNSPGNEQRDYWYSGNADIQGSRNLAGVKDPVVDKLVDLIIGAPDRTSLIQRTRALDRVLLWGNYVLPNWFNPVDRVAYTKKLAHPKVTPKDGVNLDTWWFKP